MTSTCPWCAAVLDGNMRVGGDQYQAPEAGDASICGSCASWSIYVDDQMTKRRATDEELAAIWRNPSARAAEHAVRTALGR